MHWTKIIKSAFHFLSFGFHSSSSAVIAWRGDLVAEGGGGARQLGQMESGSKNTQNSAQTVSTFSAALEMHSN